MWCKRYTVGPINWSIEKGPILSSNNKMTFLKNVRVKIEEYEDET